jgi:hypothetical protein
MPVHTPARGLAHRLTSPRSFFSSTVKLIDEPTHELLLARVSARASVNRLVRTSSPRPRGSDVILDRFDHAARVLGMK